MNLFTKQKQTHRQRNVWQPKGKVDGVSDKLAYRWQMQTTVHTVDNRQTTGSYYKAQGALFSIL